MNQSECSFYSGGLRGAEETFGQCAEQYNINETNYSFEGHKLARDKNVTVLTPEELAKGEVSMEIVSTKMGRRYAKADQLKKVFQVIFHMINSGFQVFAVGWIQEDNTVMGGTGWGIALAKFFNRPVSVFDQDKNEWFTWDGKSWVQDTPVISHKTFCGTGTRNLTDQGKKAIEDLFARSF
ncbi:MAG: hypothetical protein JXX29_01720 [Deltaproteobacteria bacterium]|nr:hypothetical protein [Deltaproteobacteria bacterium]MBN2670358.1 hypothetical protein [Deltaproteobacteria bacterium]